VSGSEKKEKTNEEELSIRPVSEDADASGNGNGLPEQVRIDL
jgi:hypothetical protein